MLSPPGLESSLIDRELSALNGRVIGAQFLMEIILPLGYKQTNLCLHKRL
jgi:hypothetical protein